MSTLESLIAKLTDRGASLIEIRTRENYCDFLALHEQFEECPRSEDAKAMWRARCVDTWSTLDSVLPGTFTGGRFAGHLVSGFGTLPFSPTVLYGHSLRMIKTLEAAATAYTQFLYSLEWMEKLPAMEYWAGSYHHGQRFVVMLQQRPLAVTIPDQLEFYALRCSPTASPKHFEAASAFIVDSSPEDEALISPEHAAIYRHLSSSHPQIGRCHRVLRATVRCSHSNKPLALVLLQTSLPELTAVNIFAAPWIFPVAEEPDVLRLYHRIRNIEELESRRLEVLLPIGAPPDPKFLDDNMLIYFWALAPRKSLPALRQSFRFAFEYLLSKYPDDQLGAFCKSFVDSPRTGIGGHAGIMREAGIGGNIGGN